MGQPVQIVVEGPDAYVRGFLRGLAAGSGSGRWPLFHHDLGIVGESLGEALKEWVGLARDATWAVVDARDLDLLRRGLADPRESELTLRSARPILGAGFAFKAEAFTPELAEEVRALFEQSLPEGVTVTGWAPTEQRDEDARGMELYAPAHDFELRGKGRVDGPFRDVLVLHERARRVAMVAEGRLELRLGDELGGGESP